MRHANTYFRKKNQHVFKYLFNQTVPLTHGLSKLEPSA